MAKGSKTGGRKKGVPNKVNADLRAMIEGALHDAGGRKYLAAQAKESPSAFITLIGRLLPKDVKVEANVRLKLEELILTSVRPDPPGR